jgi:hypothetical protein
MSLRDDINPGGARWTILSTVTASSDATIDITGDMDGTYTDYVVKIRNLIPATDLTKLKARISTDGGSTWKSGTSDYSWTELGKLGGSLGNTSDAADSELDLTNSRSLGSAAGESLNGDLTIYNPSNSSVNCVFGWKAYYYNVSYSNMFKVAGVYEGATTAVDGIQFFMSSGNISSGTFTLYGVN